MSQHDYRVQNLLDLLDSLIRYHVGKSAHQVTGDAHDELRADLAEALAELLQKDEP